MKEMIGRVVGFKYWHDNMHLQIGVSEAKCPWPGYEDKPLLGYTDEPYTVLLTLNHKERAINQAEYKMSPEYQADPKMPEDSKANREDEVKGPIIEKLYASRYSTNKTGKNPYGGWKEEGMAKFNELIELYYEAKYEDPENPRTSAIKTPFLEWEKKYLEVARIHCGYREPATDKKAKPEGPKPVQLAFDACYLLCVRIATYDIFKR